MNWEHAVYALLFFLPAGIANMTPIFVSRWPLLKNWRTPLDFGKSYRGKRILGPNKTVRGLVCGVIAGTATGLLLHDPFFSDESTLGFALLCAAISFGALVGDAAESFFKRQRGIPSGTSWFPFDQTDYIIGGLLFTIPFGILPLWLVLWVFGLYFGLHLLSSFIGYMVGLKERPI